MPPGTRHTAAAARHAASQRLDLTLYASLALSQALLHGSVIWRRGVEGIGG
jgi:hypothetical protein